MIPKILAPRIKVNIPTIKKDIYIKPYTIQVEKSIILSDQDNIFEAIRAVYNIVKDCVLDNSIDVDELYLGEFIYLFIQLQKASVGDELKLRHKHGDHDFPLSLHLSDIVLDNYGKGYSFDVATEEGDYVVGVDYPKVKSFLGERISDNQNKEMMTKFISYMCSKDGNNEVVLTNQDKLDILECLPAYEIQKIAEMSEKMPMPRVDIKVECPVCHEIVEEKIDNFFM